MSQKFGIYRAVVADNKDPLDNGRLKLNIPQILGANLSGWAWPLMEPTHTPEPGSGVWVMFEAGDPSYPVWLGSFGQ